MNGVGVLPGYRISYIDHIVPLCHALNFSIVCTERYIQELIQLYYPFCDVRLCEARGYDLDAELKNYSVFFSVDHARKGHGSFQFAEYVCTHKARSIYTPHGNSDKNWNSYWIEKLLDEDLVLIYGEQMADYMRAKGVYRDYLLTGNFRLEYYLKFQKHFDDATSYQLNNNIEKKTILYAPTWTTTHRVSDKRFDYSSFFEACYYVLDSIPEQYQVVVKLHPHLSFLHGNLVEEVKTRYERSAQVLFLDDFPLIYPLLKRCDVYIGDYSSIGYDFLYFDRPLIFLNSHEKSSTHYLQQCGLALGHESFPRIYWYLDQLMQKDHELYSAKRKKVYHYAFGARKSLGKLKNEVNALLLEPALKS